jgi:hypothetical protein
VPDEPTRAQSLLLRAVTLPAEQAVDAWSQWAHEVAVDDLEPDSQWLLPLLYTRLRDAEVSSSSIERYANVFRHNWYKSNVRVRALRPVLDQLRGFGHEPVLIGAASLAVAYYPVLGVRPFESMTLVAPQTFTADQMRTAERCLPAQFGTVIRWDRSHRPVTTRELAVVGLALRVPDRANAFVDVLANAVNRPHGDDVSRLLWAVDAVTVSRTLDAKEWAAVSRIAGERDVASTVEACLEWLRAAGLHVERASAA